MNEAGARQAITIKTSDNTIHKRGWAAVGAGEGALFQETNDQQASNRSDLAQETTKSASQKTEQKSERLVNERN
jgi:hypothetical protein